MSERVLKIERIIKAAPDRIWRAITEPKLLEQWFCPKPWFVKDVVYDLRVGGKGSLKICGPNGEEMPNSGVFLAVEPNNALFLLMPLLMHGYHQIMPLWFRKPLLKIWVMAHADILHLQGIGMMKHSKIM